MMTKKRFTKDGQTFYKQGDKVGSVYCVSEKWLREHCYGEYITKQEDGVDGVISIHNADDTYNSYYVHYLGAPHVEQPKEEEPEPEYVPTAEELLQVAISHKVQEIEAYNNSDAVNQFSYGGQQMPWISLEDRKTYFSSIQAAETRGDQTIIVPIAGGIQMPVAQAKALISTLIGYCDKAGIATQMAIAKVQAMTTIEEVNGFDYKSLYPTPIAL